MARMENFKSEKNEQKEKLTKRDIVKPLIILIGLILSITSIIIYELNGNGNAIVTLCLTQLILLIISDVMK